MIKILQKSTLILGCLTSFNSFSQFTCGDSLLDTRDGKKYATVLIGSECWMAQNLNIGTTATSVTTSAIHYDMLDNGIIEKYPSMGNSSNFDTHGGLYEWPEMMNYTTTEGGQGICPNGWHVPSDAEWQTMIIAGGGSIVNKNGGNKFKRAGEGVLPDGMGTNTSGFTARNAGDRDGFGVYYGLDHRAIFWTSSLDNGNAGFHYTFWIESDTIERLFSQKQNGFSCRCVYDGNGSGINELEKDIDLFQIYPNPAKSYFEISMNTNFKNASYIITNSVGQEIIATEITAKYTNISVESIKDGIYFISIISDGNKQDKKIIIRK